MGEDYNTFISTHSKQIVEDSILISEYFAKQFAKTEIRGDYDYLPSAIYTERVVHMQPGNNIEIGGILYPSVKTLGKGFNIALTPTTTDTCLQLRAVGECTIYKKVDNDCY